VLKELLETMVTMEHKVLKALPEIMVTMVHKVLKEHRVPLVT
jgi:hypothetical protein